MSILEDGDPRVLDYGGRTWRVDSGRTLASVMVQESNFSGGFVLTFSAPGYARGSAILPVQAGLAGALVVARAYVNAWVHHRPQEVEP